MEQLRFVEDISDERIYFTKTIDMVWKLNRPKKSDVIAYVLHFSRELGTSDLLILRRMLYFIVSLPESILTVM